VLLPFAFAYVLSYLYRTVNAVIAPDLVARFELSPAQLGLLTSAYFLTFAAFQLPLGLLLERFGPRRTDAALLVVAAAGAFLFAAAGDASALALGRALIGLGVSGCLMSGIKANVLWFPTQRLPAMNGWMFFAGGIGMVAAWAFLAQWGIGAIIERWPASGGQYHSDGFRAALAAFLLVQALGYAWMLRGWRDASRSP
jgi:MFS family permease